MPTALPNPTPHLSTLPNGVRVLCFALPHAATASVSVFVRTGSAHEPARNNGISHVVEHMVFKGTRERDRHRINLDAERLGAEVNAHTDKDHTAFHLCGLPQHATSFVHMLGDLVQHPVFPDDELERERQVLLSEYAEDEDDALATAFKLFDKACFGLHPFGRPVIGTRQHIERFTRQDLAEHVRTQYTAGNVIVAAAGPLRPADIADAARQAFGGLPVGLDNLIEPAVYLGGIASRHVPGTGQAHAVMGFPIPPLAADDAASTVAAAVLGEGMSSPLMERLREERGLVYYAACSADVFDGSGQFVVEASMAPERLDECLAETAGLIAAHARRVKPVDLERARCQILVRRLRAQDNAARLLEEAALDLFAMGRVRPVAERAARIESVTGDEVRQAFRRMLAAGPTVAVAGQVGRGVRHRVRAILDAHF